MVEDKDYQIVVLAGIEYKIPEPAATILAEAFIRIRKEESRAKGNWTDDDLFDAMEFIGTCPIASNADLIKWWKYFMIKQKEKNDN